MQENARTFGLLVCEATKLCVVTCENEPKRQEMMIPGIEYIKKDSPFELHDESTKEALSRYMARAWHA